MRTELDSIITITINSRTYRYKAKKELARTIKCIMNSLTNSDKAEKIKMKNPKK